MFTYATTLTRSPCFFFNIIFQTKKFSVQEHNSTFMICALAHDFFKGTVGLFWFFVWVLQWIHLIQMFGLGE